MFVFVSVGMHTFTLKTSLVDLISAQCLFYVFVNVLINLAVCIIIPYYFMYCLLRHFYMYGIIFVSYLILFYSKCIYYQFVNHRL